MCAGTGGWLMIACFEGMLINLKFGWVYVGVDLALL